MICPQCYGRRPTFTKLCKVCGGSGYIQCCEGERAQPYDLEQHQFADGREETVDVARIRKDLGIDD